MATLRNGGITPSIVVVDAWIDTVPGGVQVKDPQKARLAVAPWKQYAADMDTAVLLVAHTNRPESQDIRNTYGLSGALRQVARSTLHALEDPDTNALLVGPDKSNLGGKGVAHRFKRTPVEHFTPTADSDGTVALLESLGDQDMSIQEILVDLVQTAKPAPRTDQVDLWLKGVLADGPMATVDVESLGDLEGYTPTQSRRSRDRMGAASRMIGTPSGR